MAGISTLIQLYPIKMFGARVPTVFSVGFTFVPTLTAIGAQYGLSGVFGAQIIAGIVTLIMGFGQMAYHSVGYQICQLYSK